MRHSVREAMQTSSARMRQIRKEELASSVKKAAPGATGVADGRAKNRAQPPSGDESESDGDPSPLQATAKAKKEQPRDFEKISTSAPRRLNDIVQAPPEIKALPRKAKKLATQGSIKMNGGTKSLSEGVLSMAQKAMMEEERERAIKLYREMKKGKVIG